MKKDYVKALLYAYPSLQKMIERIDELVERKALNSINEHLECIKQCDKIIKLTTQKGIIFEIKYYLDKILDRLTEQELAQFQYKYLKMREQSVMKNIDISNRSYYRKQNRLLETFSDCLSWLGKDDEWFETKCKRVPYVKKLLALIELNAFEKKTMGKATKKGKLVA